LWAKGLNAQNIHKEMFPVYGGKCLSRKAVHNCVQKFSQGRSKVADDGRLGRPVEIVTEATVLQRVEELIRTDRRITTDSAATALGCSYGLAYSTMHDRLKFLKVCSRWVRRELKAREEMDRKGLSLQHLLRYADEGEDMRNGIVIGDESWVLHYQIESRPASMQWKLSSSASLSTRKFKVTPSAGKVMLAVFWDSQGVLLAHFQKHGENVNSASDCGVVLKLRDAQANCQEKYEYCFVMTIPEPHTARATQVIIQEPQWELLKHPSYSPHLTPSDFRLFDPIKEPAWWQTFRW
jgi:hypothetical protein